MTDKYKRVYKESINGELECVGLIKQGETIKVIKNLTPKQIAIINQKNDLKSHCKELGGYLHVCYVKNQLLFNALNLKPATISRFLYLATYIDYNNREENVLVKHGKDNKIEYMTKKDIRKVLKLGEKAFYDFLKEVKEKELFFEENKKFYLNPKYVNKGRNNFKNKEYIRMFIDTTRELYENCTPRQHRQLSYVYQLLPFLHYESNILCKNPQEKEIELLDKLHFTDISRMLGLSDDSKSISNLKKDLRRFYVTLSDKKYYFLCDITIGYGDKKENYYVVNPYVVWKGTNIENAKAIIKYCMIK